MKIIRKIVASVTAAACVVAFNTVAVSSAFAADNGVATVALTIIDNDDPNDPQIIRNTHVTVPEGSTVADVLDAAGFDAVDSIEDTAKDPYTTYCLSGSYPYFNGKAMEANDDGSWVYWVDLYNGEVDTTASTASVATVVNGAHYQYVYDTITFDEDYNTDYSFSYSDYADLIDDPLSASKVNSLISIIPFGDLNKKNISSAAWLMDEVEEIFNGLSSWEKEKVAYDVVQLRDSIIKAQDSFALADVAKTKTVKAKANKKVTKTFKKVTSDSGNKVMYSQKTKNAKVTVNKNGKITVKKGLKKTVKIKVVAYCGVEATKNITLKVKAA